MNNPKDNKDDNEWNGRMQHMESRLGEVLTCTERTERLVGEQIAAVEARLAEQVTASEARMAKHMQEQMAAVEARVGEQIAASEARMAEQIAASEARTNAKLDKICTALNI